MTPALTASPFRILVLFPPWIALFATGMLLLKTSREVTLAPPKEGIILPIVTPLPVVPPPPKAVVKTIPEVVVSAPKPTAPIRKRKLKVKKQEDEPESLLPPSSNVKVIDERNRGQR